MERERRGERGWLSDCSPPRIDKAVAPSSGSALWRPQHPPGFGFALAQPWALSSMVHSPECMHDHRARARCVSVPRYFLRLVSPRALLGPSLNTDENATLATRCTAHRGANHPPRVSHFTRQTFGKVPSSAGSHSLLCWWQRAFSAGSRRGVPGTRMPAPRPVTGRLYPLVLRLCMSGDVKHANMSVALDAGLCLIDEDGRSQSPLRRHRSTAAPGTAHQPPGAGPIHWGNPTCVSTCSHPAILCYFLLAE